VPFAKPDARTAARHSFAAQEEEALGCVSQMCGRALRTQSDRAACLLLDRRFALFAGELCQWVSQHVQTSDEPGAVADLAAFYGGGQSLEERRSTQ